MPRRILPLIFILWVIPSLGSANILEINAIGPGCERDSVSTVLSGDGTVITVVFNDYFAEFDLFPQSSCRLIVTLELIQGMTLDAIDLSFFGFASIEKGSSAIVKSSIRVPALWRTLKVGEETISGFWEDDFTIHQRRDLQKSLFIDECHQDRVINLELTTEINLRKASIIGEFLSLDGTDVSLFQKWGLAYRSCSHHLFYGRCVIEKVYGLENAKTSDIVSAKGITEAAAIALAEIKAKDDCRDFISKQRIKKRSRYRGKELPFQRRCSIKCDDAFPL